MENQNKKKPIKAKEYDRSVVENFLGVKNLDLGKKRVEAQYVSTLPKDPSPFKPSPFSDPPPSPATSSDHEPEYIIDPDSPKVETVLQNIGEFQFEAKSEKRVTEPLKENRPAKKHLAMDPVIQKQVLMEMEQRLKKQVEQMIEDKAAITLTQYRIDFQALQLQLKKEREFNWILFKRQHDLSLEIQSHLDVLTLDYNNRYVMHWIIIYMATFTPMQPTKH